MIYDGYIDLYNIIDGHVYYYRYKNGKKLRTLIQIDDSVEFCVEYCKLNQEDLAKMADINDIKCSTIDRVFP